MARLYSNENFPLPVVEALRQLGHDVLTIRESGLDNQEYPDDGVLKFATANSRAVLTINRKDFFKLHKRGDNHGGIIACTADTNFIGQAQRIHQEIAAHTSLVGQLIRVNRPLVT